MTLQQMVEDVKIIFPNIGETQIIKEFDLAQKTLCSEAGLIEESGELANVTSYISWNLPNGFVKLDRIDFYNSNNQPLYKEELNIDFQIYDGQIHFFSLTDTPLSSMPSSIDGIVLRYERMPSDLGTIDSTVDIDEVEYPAMEALVLKRLYSKTPMPKFVDADGKIVSVVDLNQVKYWDAEYFRLKVEAKKRKNTLDDTSRDAVFYSHTGRYYFRRRTKEASISTITIPSYSSLYSKYVRFTAVSPGTFTEIQKIGYGDLSYSMDGDDIVITSTAEFREGDTWADDIQNSSHKYVSANEFRFTPESNWGTTVIELWDFGDA